MSLVSEILCEISLSPTGMRTLDTIHRLKFKPINYQHVWHIA